MSDLSLSPEQEEMQQCIEDCQRCHTDCLRMAMNHCLSVGGKHIEKNHFSLLLSCAEICQTTANAMLSGSPLHRVLCRACAEVCEACAASCEAVGDMEDCIESCRLCADSCREMAQDMESQPL